MSHNPVRTRPDIDPPSIREQRLLDMSLMLLLQPHRLAVSFFWRFLGKKLRARGKLDAAIANLPFVMERRMARLDKADLKSLAPNSSNRESETICVHVHVSNDDEPICAKAALKALGRQSLAPLRVFITSDGITPTDELERNRVRVIGKPCMSRIDGIAAALVEAKALGARWLVPCSSKSTLTPNSLAAFEAQISSASLGTSARVIYGDTRETTNGVLAPLKRRYWLKPQWDRRMFLSQDYVTTGCAVAVDQSLDLLSGKAGCKAASLFELVLRLGEEEGAVKHLPRVVAQARSGAWRRPDGDRLEAVKAVLKDSAAVTPGPFGTLEVRYSLPASLPSVTVVVATRDRLDLLRPCVAGVLEDTDYPALDLIVADNDSVEPETLSYLENLSDDPRVKVVRWPHSFNYSAINNFAARHATGQYLCLLNNDIEVIERGWLIEMMREAVQSDVGAVGARLLYPDLSIQHAGVAIGIGNAAGHMHRGLPAGEPGYFAQALIARCASAVTAACLLVEKDLFDQVGGLDEDHLAVAYNDVDLCLKLQEQGLRNVYTPLACLIHHESKSRGLDFAPEHLERYLLELEVFQRRWETKAVIDPWHHSLLARSSETYGIGQNLGVRAH